MDTVTLDIRIDEFSVEVPNGLSEKQLYKKVPSKRIKSSEENEEKELLSELKKLIDTKSGKGKEAMEKQFEKRKLISNN